MIRATTGGSSMSSLNLAVARHVVFNVIGKPAKKARGWRGLSRVITKGHITIDKPTAKKIVLRFIEEHAPDYADWTQSARWKQLRYETLKKYGARCQCCGRTAKDGVKLHVDHIKPRSLYPELIFDSNNLQVLCEDCNLGKLNRDEVDWRS
jgi:hypothetical protein